MRISRNTVATVSYVVTDESDKLVGRTDPSLPVVALIGHNYLVPGLEKALDGHEKGDELTIKLNPQDAYGEIDENLIQTIDREMFGDYDVEVGSVFMADTSVGEVSVRVKEITEDKVVVDGNHPLAGQTLNFFVTVEDVREASKEELEHGHAHPDGQCPSEHHCGCGGHGHGGGCCGGKGHHHGEDEGHVHHCGCGHHHHGEDAEDEEHAHGHHCGCGHHH